MSFALDFATDAQNFMESEVLSGDFKMKLPSFILGQAKNSNNILNLLIF